MNKSIALVVVALIAFFVFNSNAKMPSEVLQVHNQDEYSSLGRTVGGRCDTTKCLTIYVAPWCPVCTSLNPMILTLSKELKSEGVDVKVIVGQDSLKNTKNYADKYPFPVLLDPEGKFFNKADQQGVPFFLVSNQNGEISNELSGGFEQVSRMRKELKL